VEQIIRIGMDTSKHLFQLHGVNAAEQPVLRKKLRRKEMIEFCAKLPATVIAIEACGASHHWARLLGSLGHWPEPEIFRSGPRGHLVQYDLRPVQRSGCHGCPRYPA
jgi:hypothetical protein